MGKSFLYVFLLCKLKKCTKAKVVTKDFLREELARVIVRKGGLPKRMIKYIIQDLVDLGLVQKQNRVDLYVLNDDPQEKKIRNLMDYI